MRFSEYRFFEKDDVADGGVFEDDWTAKEDRIIKRFHLARKDGASFTASTFYFKVEARVYTMDAIPCNVFGPDVLTTPELNVPIKKGETFTFTLKNREGVTISVMVTLELWRP